MAKKLQKSSAPKWLKSKWFLLLVALIVAGFAIVGYMSSAATSYPTSYSTCTKKVLSKGSTGDCVKYAQDKLNYYCKNSYLPLPISVDLTVDGQFGDKTRVKTQGFQKATGLVPADGIIGPATWSKLTAVYLQGKQDVNACRYP